MPDNPHVVRINIPKANAQFTSQHMSADRAKEVYDAVLQELAWAVQQGECEVFDEEIPFGE